jgi:hypothetical protein
MQWRMQQTVVPQLTVKRVHQSITRDCRRGTSECCYQSAGRSARGRGRFSSSYPPILLLSILNAAHSPLPESLPDSPARPPDSQVPTRTTASVDLFASTPTPETEFSPLTSPADAPPPLAPPSTDLPDELVHPEMRRMRRSSTHDHAGHASPERPQPLGRRHRAEMLGDGVQRLRGGEGCRGGGASGRERSGGQCGEDLHPGLEASARRVRRAEQGSDWNEWSEWNARRADGMRALIETGV